MGKKSLFRGFPLLIGETEINNQKVFTFNFILYDSNLGRAGGIYFRYIVPQITKSLKFPVEIMKLFGVLISALIDHLQQKSYH